MLLRHFHRLSGWQRLLIGAAVGLACGWLAGLSPWAPDGLTRGLVGWCCGAGVYLLPAWWLAERSDARRTRERAQSQDQPSALILASMLAVVGASVVVIVMLIQGVKELHGATRIAHVALAVLSLAMSWLMIQTIYAFHYAHRYYQEDLEKSPNGPGLDFPGKLDPDYYDFLYYSMVVGMTSQVSDVQVTSRTMRRITLAHGVLSFAFNMLVLALSINAVAGAL